MLNLNYNINKAIGGAGCIGVMKYNYSASILIAAGGGGGAAGVPNLGTGTKRLSGGGGGGGAYYSTDISIVPNVTYNITVGSYGIGGTNSVSASNGQTSSFFGFNDFDVSPLNIITAGGLAGKIGNGVNGGTGGNSGNIIINGIEVTPSKLGGPGGALEGGAGGGASILENGLSGSTQSGGNGGKASPIFFGLQNTIGGGGGGGARTPLDPAGIANPNDLARSGGYGGGIGTATSGQSGVSGLSYAGGGGGGASDNVGGGYKNGGNGSKGVVIIKYAGKPKATVTNATTVYDGSFTTHTFETGSGTFTYTYPYPWDDVQPYQVVLCPPTYR